MHVKTAYREKPTEKIPPEPVEPPHIPEVKINGEPAIPPEAVGFEAAPQIELEDSEAAKAVEAATVADQAKSELQKRIDELRRSEQLVRDHHAAMMAQAQMTPNQRIDSWQEQLYGLSTQDTAYQQEAATRLHLPFPILSDEKLALTKAMKLPTFTHSSMTLLKRMAWIIDDGTIKKVFYPVFPPDKNAEEVIGWLQASR